MTRIYLPLLPVPVLALAVAFSACSRPHGEESATHLIPPAAVAPAPPAGGGLAAAPATRPDAEDPPSAEEIREFERPVPK